MKIQKVKEFNLAEYYINLFCVIQKTSKKALFSRTRKQEIVYLRHCAINLIYEHTNLSLKEIGAFFGGREHGTILNSIEKVKNVKEINKIYNDFLDLLPMEEKIEITIEIPLKLFNKMDKNIIIRNKKIIELLKNY